MPRFWQRFLNHSETLDTVLEIKGMLVAMHV